MMSIKRNILLSAIYQILKIIVPIITAPYVARILGSGQIGIYSYTSSVVAYFSIMAGLGTASYGAREIARNRTDNKIVSKIFWEVEILTIITSAIVIGVWGIFVSRHAEYQIIYVVLTLNIFAIMFDISWLYNGLEQFKYEITINSIMKLASVFLIFIFVRSEDDLLGYVLINAGSLLVGSLSLWISVRKFVTFIPLREIHILPHLKKTIVYFLPSIATSLYSYLDKTLIGVITRNTNENGFYEQATKIITLSNSLTFFPINSVVQARNSYLYSKNRIDEIENIMKLSMSGCLYLGIGICFGLWALSKEFVPVFFGNGYDPVVELLYIFAPIIVFTGISAVYSFQYYNPIGKINYITLSASISAAFNVVMNVLLIPAHGAQGAALASVLAEFILLLMYMRNCEGHYKSSDLFMALWKKIVAGLCMFFVVIFIKEKIQETLISLAFEIIVGFLIYTITLYIIKDDFVFEYGKHMIKKMKI